jgi:hypothetical protein
LGRFSRYHCGYRSGLHVGLYLVYEEQEDLCGCGLGLKVFDEAYRLAKQARRQIYRLVMYLKSQPKTTRVREDQIEFILDS